MQQVRFKQVFIPSLVLMLIAFGLVFLFADFSVSILFEFNFNSLFWSLCIGAVLGIGFFVLMALIMVSVRPFYSKIDDITKQLHVFFHGFSWTMIVLLSLAAGIGEELLFRGLIQRYLVYLFNPLWGIILASVIFGVCHYLNRLYVFLAFSMGFLIGGIYHFTNNLLLVMTLHAVYDFFAFTAIVKYPPLFGLQLDTQD